MLKDRAFPEAVTASRRRPDIVIRRREAETEAEILVDPKPATR
jgi:hypothetical protein